MSSELRDALVRQLDIAWSLTEYHLTGLTTHECLWRPATRGPHVTLDEHGAGIADWPESEGYDIGPPSIAWLTWHITFWWRMTIDHSFGAATLRREDMTWPGTADAVVATIRELHGTWRTHLLALSDDDLRRSERTRWPVEGKPFVDIVIWLNVELMKNASEIGYGRFLHATRAGA